MTKVVADEVDCPSGKLALGGAGSLTVGNVGAGASELTSSVPSPAGTGWETGYAKLDGSYFATTEQLSYTTYVVCAKVAK